MEHAPSNRERVQGINLEELKSWLSLPAPAPPGVLRNRRQAAPSPLYTIYGLHLKHFLEALQPPLEKLRQWRALVDDVRHLEETRACKAKWAPATESHNGR